MRDKKIGALVIVSDDAVEQLEGIFTERDLLRHVDVLQDTKLWSKPIRTVMTKNPVRVNLKNIHTAADLMMKHGFRHLPVVDEKDGIAHVVGVISMRDLFRNMYEEELKRKTALLPKDFRPPTSLTELGVLSSDALLSRFLKVGFSEAPNIIVRRIPARGLENKTNVVSGLFRLKVLVVDIDGHTLPSWTALLKNLERQNVPKIVIVFDPNKHSRQDLLTLDKLKGSKRFQIFSKPLQLVEFVRGVSEVL